MEPQDRAEIRQMLTDILSGYTEEMKGRYNVIHANLVQIKEQTTKTNGRVTKIEDEIDDLKLSESKHFNSCPHISRIEDLENSETSRKAIYKFIGGMWLATVALSGIVIAIIELVIKP